MSNDNKQKDTAPKSAPQPKSETPPKQDGLQPPIDPANATAGQFGGFSNFAKFGVQMTAEFQWKDRGTFKVRNADGTRPTLIVANATIYNVDFHDHVYSAKMEAEAMKDHSRKVSDARQLKEDREHDRPMAAKHIIKGWKDVQDDNGHPIEFSPANAEKLMQALPDNLLDELRFWVSKESNFMPVTAPKDGPEAVLEN